MENSTYIGVVSAGGLTDAFNFNPPAVTTRTTTSCQVDLEIAGGVNTDAGNIDVIIMGGL